MSLSSKSSSLLKRDLFLFATNLATGIVVARSLGPSAMGVWIILQLIPSYAEAFGRIKVDIAAVYYLGQGKYSFSDVVATLNAIALIMSGMLVVPVLIGMKQFIVALFGASQTNMQPLVTLMLLQIPATFVYMNYVYLFIYREDVKSYNRMAMARALVTSALIVCFLYGLSMGLQGVILATLIGLTVGMLYGVIQLAREPRAMGRIRLPVARDLTSYGFRMYVAGILGQLNAYLSQALVVANLLPREVAFFGMAQSQGQLITKATSAMGTILLPRVAKSGVTAEANALTARAFRVALVIVAISAAGAAIFIHPAVTIVYGSDYAPIVRPFLIMLPGLALTAAASMFIQYFSAVGRADVVVRFSVIPVLSQLLLGLLLIPRFRLAGAALSFLLASVITAGSQVWAFKQLSGVPWGALAVRRDDVATVRAFLARSLNAAFSVATFQGRAGR